MFQMRYKYRAIPWWVETYKQNVPLSQFELDWTRDHISAWSPFWHFFEDFDYFPKLSEDSPNVITRRFYERIIVFYELSLRSALGNIRELKQPRRRRQQKPYKFAYLTMKNSIFARFARAFFIFWHFEDVLVLSTTWSDLFCSCVDDVSIWCQMFNFVLFCPKRWFQIKFQDS